MYKIMLFITCVLMFTLGMFIGSPDFRTWTINSIKTTIDNNILP